MNYGYAGTKELNEALVSRFMVIDMPSQDEETLDYILSSKFPTLKENAKKQWIGLFMDLQLEAKIVKSVQRLWIFEGFSDIKTIKQGLKPRLAVQIGVVNKCFDIFEKEIVQDVVLTRIPDTWTPQDVFEK